MSREAHAAKAARLLLIIARLRAAYPTAHCELNFSTPLELLVATILSAQCTDKRVNLVTAELFQRYRRAEDYAAAPLVELEQAVRTAGFFRNKAKNIRACCCKLVELHGGAVPRTLAELTALDGVGRKTANVVLGNVFNLAEGIVVDTHVTRLANRFGLVRGTNAERIERELMPLVPREHWTVFSHWLIWHGRRRCSARKPDCTSCELAELCPRIGVKASV
jgi:endonuclease-3